MPSGEATYAICIVFGLARLGLEPTIYHTRGKYVNNYTIDAGKFLYTIYINVTDDFSKTFEGLCVKYVV